MPRRKENKIIMTQGLLKFFFGPWVYNNSPGTQDHLVQYKCNHTKHSRQYIVPRHNNQIKLQKQTQTQTQTQKQQKYINVCLNVKHAKNSAASKIRGKYIINYTAMQVREPARMSVQSVFRKFVSNTGAH